MCKVELGYGWQKGALGPSLLKQRAKTPSLRLPVAVGLGGSPVEVKIWPIVVQVYTEAVRSCGAASTREVEPSIVVMEGVYVVAG